MGGVVVLGVGIVVGAELADLAERWIGGIDPTKTPPPTSDVLPANVADIPTYNKLFLATKPGWRRIGIQLGVAAAGFVIGAFIPVPLVKTFFYGIGLGALGNVTVRVINSYVVQPLLKDSNFAKYAFAHENDAAIAFTPPATNSLGQPPAELGQQRSKNGTPIAASARATAGLPPGQPVRHPEALSAFAALGHPDMSGRRVDMPSFNCPPKAQQPPPQQPPPTPPPNDLSNVQTSRVSSGAPTGACKAGCGCDSCASRLGQSPADKPLPHLNAFMSRRLRRAA